MTLITLTTDFGTRDGNVGVMKGIIYGIQPQARIVDLSHEIEPQNIHQAAWVLQRQVFYFPENTVHVVVVDPGVGTARRPIAARIGTQCVVGPDNGVFTPLYERAEAEGWPLEIVHTDKPDYWLADISNVFHGRDIFSPVGAYLASGAALGDLGKAIKDEKRIDWPKPQRSSDGFHAQVMHVDRFGNLLSNLHRDDINGQTIHSVTLAGKTVDNVVETFGQRQTGELVTLYSSTGYVFVAEVNGSAVRQLGAKVGDSFEVQLG
ncbi:MAG: hypothetical protein DWQ07_20090 [Chloroflexi bacterium]|nr:MAG: hypothetical protein DWQ07_20090 [Chloroflexota bacterium]MBL1194382.1 hypothetical protein [Chloroflexota bacterium]NOH11670.1 SAM-dependent chlorinase/fluorinase [Chloroflexota bacterium]